MPRKAWQVSQGTETLKYKSTFDEGKSETDFPFFCTLFNAKNAGFLSEHTVIRKTQAVKTNPIVD